jgi:hypothetical protein
MTTLSLPFVPFVPSNLLRQSVVAQDASARESIVKEVGGLDVAVDNGVVVRCGERAEEGGEVGSEHGQCRLAVVGLGATQSV